MWCGRRGSSLWVERRNPPLGLGETLDWALNPEMGFRLQGSGLLQFLNPKPETFASQVRQSSMRQLSILCEEGSLFYPEIPTIKSFKR